MSNRDFVAEDETSHILNRGITSPIATVNVKGGIHLRNIAELIGVDYKHLKDINKHIKQNIIPPEEKEYEIYIPYSRLSRFNANIDNIKPTKFAVHIVKKGETLGRIGSHYKVPYKLIKKFNNLKSNIISLKQKLIIPIDPEKLPKKPTIYMVKSGDTLSKIAKKHEIKLTKLMSDNNIKTSMIRIGDKLVINYN